SRSFGGSLSSSIDQAYAVAADSAGNTYATGFYSNTIDWGVGPVSNFGSFDGFLLKLDGGNGSYVWDKVYRGTAADSGWAVEVEGNEVVVGGYFRTSVSFGGPVRTATDAGSWVAKYTTTGTYMWDRTFDGTLGDFTRDVALDPATGDVYVSGEYRNTVDFGGGPRTSTSGADAFVVKLNTDGTYEWDAIWNPGPIDVAHAIAVGPSGDAYVTGEFSGTRDLDPHPVNIFNVTSVGFEDVYVAKLLKATGTF
ncbi:MAG TPA: hypothetical protein VEI97_09205, partial [bacterium]|nr:hypothetical protein [bacterium]